jgi:hypothetical protein
MTTSDFKYDVAFSFLAEDEDWATSINDLVKERLSTFIYFEKQKELAGTDGEKTFNRVFGSEARIVFVLYRKGWGGTPWTRIEETAIRNRAFEKGYDFVIFAPLDKTSSLPEWLPKTQIWFGFDRWGIEGAASVIEARVQEAGGKPREETAEDRVARISKEIEAEKERKAFLDSYDGVKAANEEVSNIFSELEKVVAGVPDKLSIVSGGRECAIYGERFSIYLNWSQSYSNTLESSALYLSLFDGPVSIRGKSSFPFKKPTRLEDIEFQFVLSRSGRPMWREARGSKKEYSTAEFVKLALTMLLNKVLESKKHKK